MNIDEAIDGIVQHVARVVKERDELHDVLRLFKVEATGCWCSDDPRVFGHTVRCARARAALHPPKNGSE